jgi:acyl-CoA thioesterase I
MSRLPLRALTVLLTAYGFIACSYNPAPAIRAGASRNPPRAAIAVYVAIGASDSVGYGVPNPTTQGWVPLFAAALPAPTKLVNLGVVSLTLHQAVLVDLPVALDAHPRVVTVWLAVNDLLDRVPLAHYRADLHTLLERLHNGTHARILVGNLPDLTLVPAVASRLGADPGALIADWNAAIAAETGAAGATLVDLHSQWRDLAAHPDYVGPDGLHPSVGGYARLAQIFESAL